MSRLRKIILIYLFDIWENKSPAKNRALIFIFQKI
jgi:hypothetical protein